MWYSALWREAATQCEDGRARERLLSAQYYYYGSLKVFTLGHDRCAAVPFLFSDNDGPPLIVVLCAVERDDDSV